MSIQFCPMQGAIVLADYTQGFRPPEMVKKRPVIILSPEIESRRGLSTIVALSTTKPQKVMPYHYKLEIKSPRPKWMSGTMWAKGDMVNAVGWHRLSLIRLGKDATGKRQYQRYTISPHDLTCIRECVLHGLGMSSTAKALK